MFTLEQASAILRAQNSHVIRTVLRNLDPKKQQQQQQHKTRTAFYDSVPSDRVNTIFAVTREARVLTGKH